MPVGKRKESASGAIKWDDADAWLREHDTQDPRRDRNARKRNQPRRRVDPGVRAAVIERDGCCRHCSAVEDLTVYVGPFEGPVTLCRSCNGRMHAMGQAYEGRLNAFPERYGPHVSGD
ncbi:MAG: hypothetical protein ABI896_03690 [Actinomycetota bacterium]